MTNLAFMSAIPLNHSTLTSSTNYSKAIVKCASRRTRTRSLPSKMTLQPQDSSWREEGDRRAIESEFFVPVRVTGEVDDDMAMLRERIQLLGKKERQWADVCQQFISLSVLTGLPLVDAESGEPTVRAWLFLSLSAAVPLYIVCLGAQWLHSTSISFSNVF